MIKRDGARVLRKAPPMGRGGGSERIREVGQPTERVRKVHPPCPPRPRVPGDIDEDVFEDAASDDEFFDVAETLGGGRCRTFAEMDADFVVDGKGGQPPEPETTSLFH